jgi:hypothetical protein
MAHFFHLGLNVNFSSVSKIKNKIYSVSNYTTKNFLSYITIKKLVMVFYHNKIFLILANNFTLFKN